MHPVRKRRLKIVLFIVLFSAIAISLIVFAMRGNMNLFFPPAEVVSDEAPIGKQIRVGGFVVVGSVVRGQDDLSTTFVVTDGKAQVTVQYKGILPDLFSEGEAAIATGKLNADKILIASEVLAKHDENYTPPEVSETAKRPELQSSTSYSQTTGKPRTTGTSEGIQENTLPAIQHLIKKVTEKE